MCFSSTLCIERAGAKMNVLVTAVTKQHDKEIGLYPFSGTSPQLLLSKVHLSKTAWFYVGNGRILSFTPADKRNVQLVTQTPYIIVYRLRIHHRKRGVMLFQTVVNHAGRCVFVLVQESRR